MFDIPEDLVERASKTIKYHLAFQGDKSEADWLEAAQGVLELVYAEVRAAESRGLERAAQIIEPSAQSFLGRLYGAPVLLSAIRSMKN